GRTPCAARRPPRRERRSARRSWARLWCWVLLTTRVAPPGTREQVGRGARPRGGARAATGTRSQPKSNIEARIPTPPGHGKPPVGGTTNGPFRAEAGSAPVYDDSLPRIPGRTLPVVAAALAV